MQSNEPIILRWRIHKGELLFRRRHLRALDALELPSPLRGWIHERLEWAIANMLNHDLEAVLVLNIDLKNEVTVSLDKLRETPSLKLEDLIVEDGFVLGAQQDGKQIDGTVWTERDKTLFASTQNLNSATDTLAADLASTLKFSVTPEPQKLSDIKDGSVFLISDEFGFVPISDKPKAASELSAKLKECFLKLW